MATTDEPSYIDYDTFTDPSFDPRAFANSLVLLTNNANDLPLDLSTPLSRVLFDTQEIDSHIDLVTTRSAVPLLEHTRAQNAASARIVSELDAHVKSLNDSYAQLEREVVDKHAEAEEVRAVAARLWEALRLGRSASRCLQLGRQLEVQHAEISGVAGKKDDHGALVRCSHTILSLREVLEQNRPGEEGFGLEKVDAVRTLRDAVIAPIERSVRESSEIITRDFSVPSTVTFAHMEEARARLVSALNALYLLSPVDQADPEKWTPRLLLQALETYLRTSVQAAAGVLARGLGQLPTLERALADVAAKCQNVLALEAVLEGAKAPAHPLLAGGAKRQQSLLRPLLARLETGSLASFFWRSLAGSTASRVQEICSRGGVAARTLRSNRVEVGEAVKECVVKGSMLRGALASGKGKKGAEEGGWEREIAVMVGSVANNLGR